jgi:GTP-binding protein
LLDLDASEEQLDSPMIFCSGREGTASFDPYQRGGDLKPLFDTILDHIPAPEGDESAPLQVLVSSIDYNDYVGSIGIGRIERGKINVNDDIVVGDYHNQQQPYKSKVVSLYQIEGLTRVPCDEASVGDIVCISGITGITIGDTICAPDTVEPLSFVKISEPTVEMTFCVNDSPFAGKEGKFVTSRQLRERLYKELMKDVSLQVSDTDTTDKFNVRGRGEMHLSILIETMRREGYEFAVSTPRVLYKTIDGKLQEPIELVSIDLPEDCVGTVMSAMGTRKGELLKMAPFNSRMRLEFLVPARGLFGYRNEFLTETRGEGIMSSIFDSYQPYKGDIQRRSSGSLISYETGVSVTYGLYNAQERGQLFIGAGVPVYEGMVIANRPRRKTSSSTSANETPDEYRASGSDDALRLTPPKRMSLEASIEFIKDDELLEVTPKSIRIRKKILSNDLRMKDRFRKIKEDTKPE